MLASISSFDIVCCVDEFGFDQNLLEVSAEDGLRPEEIDTHPHGCIKLILVILVAEACDKWLDHLMIRV